MRSILVLADRGAQMAARLETALSIARMCGSHLTVMVDTPVGRYVSMDALGGSMVASDALDRALADDDRQAEVLDAQLARFDVPFDVVRANQEPVVAIARAALLSDLVVVSRGGTLAADLVMASRTPVLVAGDCGPLAFPLASACVAWDGSEEAALALRASVPLLASAGAVTLLSVTVKPEAFEAIDALQYLSRHGVSAELREFGRGSSVEETLALAAGSCGGQLLVMGAYGHSRLREFLFGGVTRYFLEDALAPALLIAH